MKIDAKTVIIIGLLVWIIGMSYFNSGPNTKPFFTSSPTIVGTEQKDVIPEVATDTVYITKTIFKDKYIDKKIIVVDSLYKAEYLSALKENDSLRALNLFLSSIELKTFNDTILDDKNVSIKAKIKTRGDLISYKVDYTIKPQKHEYIPEVKLPRLTILGGVDLSVPSEGTGYPNLEANLNFMNRKGSMYSVGLDSRNNISIGYKASIFRSKR